MTDNELFTAVSTAISSGLDAAYWAENAAKQTAAYNFAKNDVFARVPGLTLDTITTAIETPVVMAIAEQALFLLRHYEEQTEPTVTAESVDGVSLTYSGTGDNVMSPRCLAYLDQIKTDIKRSNIGTFRFVRG